jgi:hypothetical protein
LYRDEKRMEGGNKIDVPIHQTRSCIPNANVTLKYS